MVIPLNNQEKYPKLISRFERETGKNAVYNGKITGGFENWINQKIKMIFICNDINCRDYGKKFPSERALNSHKSWHNRYFRVASRNNNISKFFLNFLNEHVYFTKNQLIASYIEINKPLKENHTKIRKELLQLAYHLSRIGVLANYTKFTYKINKEKLKEYNGELIDKNT